MNTLQKGIKHCKETCDNIFNTKIKNNEFYINDSIIESLVEIVNEVYKEDAIKRIVAKYYNIKLQPSMYNNIRRYIEYERCYTYNGHAEFVSNNRLYIECSSVINYKADEFLIEYPITNTKNVNWKTVDRSFENGRAQLILPRSIYYLYRGSSIILNNTREYIKEQVRNFILTEFLTNTSSVLSSVEVKYNNCLSLEREIVKAMGGYDKNSITIEIDTKDKEN